MILVLDVLQGAKLEAGVRLDRIVRELAQVIWCDREAEQHENSQGVPHECRRCTLNDQRYTVKKAK